MVDAWHIYHVENCQYTIPVKDKFIAVVCFNPNPYGFLHHDSYIDCSNILSFKGSELNGIQKIQNNTRKEIKKVVSNTKLIAPIYKKLICGERD